MLRIFHDTHYDFIRWWRQAAITTIAFILAGFVAFGVTGGVNYSIDFTGGTLVQLEFKQPPGDGALRTAVEGAGFRGAEVQRFGSPTDYVVRVQTEGDVPVEQVKAQVATALAGAFGADAFTVSRSEAVSAKVGSELARGAVVALLLGALITLVYLAIRFEWRFGLAAVLTTFHDIFVTLAFVKLLDLEVSLTVVAAVLTLLGYSMNDTIIIFDRVRENLRKGRREAIRDTLNRSINETLPRSILTHGTTLAATLALLFFAGEVLRPFAWVMSFGVFAATFSSIYVASPLLMYIEQRFPRAVAGKSGGTPAAPASTTSARPRGTNRSTAAAT